MATIQEVKEARSEAWMALPGVTGVGIGMCDGEECLRVFLSRPSPEAEAAIPDRVEGFRVEVEVTGPVRSRAVPGTTEKGGAGSSRRPPGAARSGPGR